MAEIRDWKVKAEQLPDCDDNLWYVTDCDVKGVVGISAPTLDDLKAKLKVAIPEMNNLNGVPKIAEFNVAA